MTYCSLRTLLERDDSADRAYVDALVRMHWSRSGDSNDRAELESLHHALKSAAGSSHALLRARIASGELRGAALRAHFDAVPFDRRNHYVEEVLGVAYPPLDEPALEPEVLGYAPSAYDEILHAFDATGLAAGDRFLDLGSGTGKVVMLAALLAGATSTGVECNRSLLEIARAGARALGLDDECFRHDDARTAPLDGADVVFMYLPFTGATLATVMTRLLDDAARDTSPRTRDRFLCAGALDLPRYEELVPAAEPKSWLHVYSLRR